MPEPFPKSYSLLDLLVILNKLLIFVPVLDRANGAAAADYLNVPAVQAEHVREPAYAPYLSFVLVIVLLCFLIRSASLSLTNVTVLSLEKCTATLIGISITVITSVLREHLFLRRTKA